MTYQVILLILVCTEDPWLESLPLPGFLCDHIHSVVFLLGLVKPELVFLQADPVQGLR